MDTMNVIISIIVSTLKVICCIRILILTPNIRFMRLLFIYSLIILMYSCTNNVSEADIEVPFENEDISVVQKIKKGLKKDYLENIGFTSLEIIYIQDYYRSNHYQPAWINDSVLTQQGLKLKKLLQNPIHVGLPSSRIKKLKSKNYIQDEFANTMLLAGVINDLKNGFIDYNSKTLNSVRLADKQWIDSIRLDTNEINLSFNRFNPSDSSYSIVLSQLNEFCEKYKITTDSFDVVSIKIDSVKAEIGARKSLLAKGYISNVNCDSLQFKEGLLDFQSFNGLKEDGVIGKYTAIALSESNTKKVDRILLCLDKMRSKTMRPEKYIHINIPEYKLRFFINDSLKSQHNIVVGKFENQTPELTSNLRKIVFFPYWNVPYSISSKEILPAAQINNRYFEKHNYKIYRKGEEVDPLTVNWKKIKENSFPYKVVQQPGPRNSLGIVKFDFNNSHSVYFHDTPSKGLFGADVRAYSHGCMRTQNPVDLALAILERDEFNLELNEYQKDSIDTILNRGENFELKLLKQIPIFVEYQTVTATNGQIKVNIDIYGRDEEFIVLFQ